MIQIILPSIIAQNQQELDAQLAKVKGKSSLLHLDVIDGKFAPNTSLSFRFHLSKDFQYQAHLMMKKPEVWMARNMQRRVLFIPHFEEIKAPEKHISWMRKKGKKVAFALLPGSPARILSKIIKEIDYVLILTVHPGFYGSKYLKKELQKIPQLKKMNPNLKVIVDGGMNPVTIKDAVQVGADHFISGSFVMSSNNVRTALRELWKAATDAKALKREKTSFTHR